MLMLLLDFIVLWMLLNIFSDDDWNDELLKIFLIVLGITLLGGLGARALADSVGLLAMGVYVAVGIGILWTVASLPVKQAAIVMAIFLVYRVVVEIGMGMLLA